MIFRRKKKESEVDDKVIWEEEYDIRVNGEAYKNRIVSRYSLKEVIGYVASQTKQGIDEFVVLTNNETHYYIQCVWEINGYVVQIPIKLDNGKHKLVEKSGVSRKETEQLFYDFYEGKEIDTRDYSNVLVNGEIRELDLY